MRKRYGNYEYEAFFETIPNPCLEGWGYVIYTDDPDYKFHNGTDVYRESQDLFDAIGEAELAAIGHISMLENGEG